MFVNFFQELKEANLPVTLREYLTLLEALEAGIPNRNVEDFYYLSRSTLVKDERNLDKFDRVFGHIFKGLENIEEDERKLIDLDFEVWNYNLHLLPGTEMDDEESRKKYLINKYNN